MAMLPDSVCLIRILRSTTRHANGSCLPLLWRIAVVLFASAGTWASQSLSGNPEEVASWKAARTATEVDPVEQYLRRFPHGRFVTQAREKLLTLLIHDAEPLCSGGSYNQGLKLINVAAPLIPPNFQVLAIRAACQAAAGDHQGAVEEISLALKLSPNNPDLYFNRGTFYLQLPEPKKAFEDLSKAIELRPSYGPSWGNRCSALLQLGRYGEAIADCTKALSLSPRDPLDLQSRAVAYFQLRKFDLALADADAAIQSSPNQGNGWVLRALVRFNMQQTDAAIQDINQSLSRSSLTPSTLVMRAALLRQFGRIAQALQDLDAVLEKDPRLELARIERARCYLAEQQYEKCRRDLDVLLKADNKNPELYYLRGIARGSLGEIDGELADLSESIHLDSKSARELKLRANLYKEIGQLQNALADVNEVIHRSPDDPAAYALRGYIEKRLKLTDKAEQDFRKAVDIGPKVPQVYILQGDAYRAEADYGRSLLYYGLAIRADSTNGEARSQRGSLLMELRMNKEALRDFDYLSHQKPWTTFAERKRADVLLNMNRYAEALESANRAIDAQPTGLEAQTAYYTRGKVYKALNACDMAVSDFSYALKYAPTDAALLNDRATCYITLNKIDLALHDVNGLLTKQHSDANALILRGNAEWARGDVNRALLDFTEAANVQPSNYSAHVNRAEALGKLNRPAEGIKAASRAIELNPNDLTSLRLRGNLYFDIGQSQSAFADYVAAYRQNQSSESLSLVAQIYQKLGGIPKSLPEIATTFNASVTTAAPQIIRARLYYAMNDQVNAINDLNEVIRTFPHIAEAYRLRAEIRNHSGDMAGYEADLRKTIELDARDYESMNNLAYSLASRGEGLSEARELISQALRYEPYNASYIDTRGWIEFRANKLSEAELYLRRAALYSNDAVIQDHVAQFLVRKGDMAGARRHWKIALRVLEQQTARDEKRIAELREHIGHESESAADASAPSIGDDLLGVMEISADLDCIVAIDDRDFRRVKDDELVFLPLISGHHELRAVSANGLYSWTTEFIVKPASKQNLVVQLQSVKEASDQTAAKLKELEASLPKLQHTLEAASEKAKKLRLQAVEHKPLSPLEKRRQADELREKLVRYIESLEEALKWETSEANRLKGAAQEAQSASTDNSSSIGQVIGLINKGTSLKLEHSDPCPRPIPAKKHKNC